MGATRPGTQDAPRGRLASRRRLHDTLAGYLFIGPSAIIVGVFGIFPVFFTIYVSLFRWRLARGPFSGLDNFVRLFGSSPAALAVVLAAIGGMAAGALLLRGSGRDRLTAVLRRVAGASVLCLSVAAFIIALPFLASRGDKEVFDSLRVTIWYSLCTVPVQLAGGLLLAVLLTRPMRGRQAFRVIYLVPYIAPTVATAAVYELLCSLRPDSFANQVLKLMGSGPLQWLQEPKGILTLLFGAGMQGGAAQAAEEGAAQAAAVIPAYWGEWAQGPSLALTAIVFYSWWVFIGYYALLYINGLGSIPRQLYEAAEVDGAGKLRSFFSITLPLLSPTTYFLSLLGIIGTFKAFTHLYVLRSTAAAGTVDPVSVLIFFTAFRKGNMGYASAIAILLFVIVLGLTALQQRTTEKSVTYGD